MVEVLQGVTGRTTDTVYDLFFDMRKMVIATVLHPSDLIEMYTPDMTAIFLGGALKSGEIKIRTKEIIDKKRLAFKDKNVDEILALDKANEEVDYGDIQFVSIKKSFLSTHLEFKLDKCQERKLVFSLRKDQVTEARKVIKRIFPEK